MKNDELDPRVDHSQYPSNPVATAASNEPVPAKEPQPCEACGGDGQMVIGEHYVTQDMASDAGEPSMAGSFYGYAYGPCDACGGSGVES